MNGTITKVACLLTQLSDSPYATWECYPALDGESLVVATKRELELQGYEIQEPEADEKWHPSNGDNVIERLS